MFYIVERVTNEYLIMIYDLFIIHFSNWKVFCFVTYFPFYYIYLTIYTEYILWVSRLFDLIKNKDGRWSVMVSIGDYGDYLYARLRLA